MPVIETSDALIAAIDQADSPESLISAVLSLAEARSEAGIPKLIQVLGFNNPSAAVVAVQGLVNLGSAAVAPLLELLDDYNYGARAWAIRALAAIADPRSLAVLLSAAATDFAPSVRRAATRGLGAIDWQLLPEAERLAAQTQTLETLLHITADPDWSLRYAAIVGLQAMAAALSQSLQVQATLRLQQMAEADSDLAVLARAKYALMLAKPPFSTAQPTP